MSTKVLSFFRPAPGLRDDWSQQELAEFYRVEAATVQSGLRIITDRGMSDEGDPWFVFCRVQDESVFLHVARINGLYWIACDGIDVVLRGPNFRALLSELTRTHPTFLQIPPQTESAKVLLHPSALLAAIVATACLLAIPREALASELGGGHTDLGGGHTDTLGPPDETSLAYGLPHTDASSAEASDAMRRATIAGLSLLVASVALSMPEPVQTLSQRSQAWLHGSDSQAGDHQQTVSGEKGFGREGDLIQRATQTSGQVAAADGISADVATGPWSGKTAPRSFGPGPSDTFLNLSATSAGFGSAGLNQATLDLRGIDFHDLAAGTSGLKFGDIAWSVLLASRAASTPGKAIASIGDGHQEAAGTAAGDKAQPTDPIQQPAKQVAATSVTPDSTSPRAGTTGLSTPDSTASDLNKIKAVQPSSSDSVPVATTITKSADVVDTKATDIAKSDSSASTSSSADATKTDTFKIKSVDTTVTPANATKVVLGSGSALPDNHSILALVQRGDDFTSTSQNALRKAGLALFDGSSVTDSTASTSAAQVPSAAATPSTTSTATHDAATPATTSVVSKVALPQSDTGSIAIGASTTTTGQAPGSTTGTASSAVTSTASTTATHDSGTAAVAATTVGTATAGTAQDTSAATDKHVTTTGTPSTTVSVNQTLSTISPDTVVATTTTKTDPSLRPLDSVQLQLINSFIANTPHLGATLVDHTLLLYDTVPVIGSSAQVTTWDLGDGSRLEIVGLSNVVHT